MSNIKKTIAFTRIVSNSCDLRKEYALESDKSISKKAIANLSNGMAYTDYVQDLSIFGSLISKYKKKEALATGLLPEAHGHITTSGKERPDKKVYSRTVKYMKTSETCDYIQLLDNDPHKDGVSFDTAQEFADYFYSLQPNLKDLELFVSASSSAGIHNEGVMRDPKPSWHGFLRVDPEVTQKQLRDYIENICWGNGDGYIALSKNGSKLKRTTFDMAVFSPERLIYEAKPKLIGGLKQKKYETFYQAGRAICKSDIGLETSVNISLLQDEAEAAIEDEAQAVNKEFTDNKISDLLDLGIPPDEAERAVNALTVKEFTLNTIVTMADGKEVSVRDMCLAPSSYNNMALADPIEGPSYGKTTAKFYWNKGKPKINSMAHGGTTYSLNNSEVLPTIEKPKALGLEERANLIDFPHAYLRVNGDIEVPMSVGVVAHLADVYGFDIKRNLVSKVDEVSRLGDKKHSNDVGLNRLKSVATLNALPYGQISNHVDVIASDNQYNPVLDWIASKKWDGIPRLNSLLNAIKVEDGWEDRRKTYFTKWAYSAVGMLSNTGDLSTRGVLTMTGPQNIGKTYFLQLLTGSMWEYCLDGLTLEPENKDSVKKFASHWIVELGELDATFKKSDISALKAFTTLKKDTLRLPYDKYETTMPRSTVVIASVNDREFLADVTGNSRFWVLPVTDFDFDALRKIDTQQLWAEISEHLDLALGLDSVNLPWFLNTEESEALTISNQEFEVPCEVKATLLRHIAHSNDLFFGSRIYDVNAKSICEKLNLHTDMGTMRKVGKVLRDALGYKSNTRTRTYTLSMVDVQNKYDLS